MLYKIRRTTIFLGVVFYVTFLSQSAVTAVLSEAPIPRAQVITLDDIVLRANEQNNIQIVLRFSGAVNVPQNFSVEDPPAIAFDFAHIKNKTSREVLQKISATGVLENVDILESEDKTRVVLNLVKMVTFDLKVNASEVLIDLNGVESSAKPIVKKLAKSSEAYSIQSFDFRRGDNGEGRLIVSLSNPKASVDVVEALNQTTLAFLGASIEDKLLKKYDVVDFATPVHGFEITRDDGVVNVRVSTIDDYNKIVYQLDNQFILEARPKKNDDKVLDNTAGGYSGNKISLNFQNIEIRSVLQVIADFSKFNMIASDSVKGNITLRLDNLPWDQALDIILKSKGLDKRQTGNVMMVGASEELASREKSELENQKQAQELGILKSELIQINYAQADDIATMLKDKSNSLLTSRGNVTVDKRTNTLLIQDIPGKIAEVKTLLKKLDIPVRQVEISTQIVQADKSLEDSLGVRFGGGANAGFGHRQIGIGAGIERARAIASTGQPPPPNPIMAHSALSTQGSGDAAVLPTVPTVQNSEGLFSDLGATATAGGLAQVGLALARLPNGTLLDLELEALEYETSTKTLSRPKLVTMDQVKATVSKGTQVPYQQSSSSGATTTAYQDAVLKLDVTPHITADDRISLDLNISNDTVGPTLNGSSSINTSSIQTKVLVDNGATIVLGGVLSISDKSTQARVPFFGSLPVIGGLFRNKYTSHSPSEMIIFITPKIINTLKDKA